MTAYDAGTAFLQVVPSWRGWDADVTAKIRTTQEQLRKGIADALPAGFRDGARAAAPQGAKAGEEFGGAFAQSVRRRIEAGLKALPKVEINADSSDTDVKIAAIRAQLEELHGKRIGIDIDEGLALAQILALQGDLDRLAREDPSIAVRIDAARAASELAAIQEEVNHLDGETANVTVRVNEEHVSSAGAGLSGGFGLLGAGVAASPLAVPLGAAAVGGLSGIATVAGAGAGALGVLGLGLSNIKSAVTDIAAAHTAAGAAAAKAGATQLRAALAVAAAERGVKSAEDALVNARANAADAAITAAERVQSALAAQAAAERNLSTAQRAQMDAQQALTEARKTAQQQIEDLTQAVADGQLSQRQAGLDVSRARLNLQEVNSNPLSTQLERQQARLDYDQAVQRQKDLATQQQRTVDAQKAAVKAGVDGSAVVVTAQRNVVAANQAVIDAYAAIKTAAQGVTDAQRAQASQARQSAYAIEQAQVGVVNAMASVQSAMASASTAGSTQLAAVQGRLAALSPAALSFATFINNTLKPAFAGLRGAVQASLLPNLQVALSALLPVLPALTSFMAGLATVLGEVFVQASKALASPFWQQFFGYVSATAGPTIRIFAEVLGNLATGFAGLLMAFKPVSDGLGAGILALTRRFADFATHLGSNSGFQAFLAYVKREGPAVAHFFGDVLSIVGGLLQGLAPLGAMLLDVTNSVLDLIKQLGPAGLLLAVGAVATVVAALGGPVTAIVVAVTAFAGAVTYAYEHVKPFHDFIHDHLIPVLERIWKDVLAGVRDAFAQVTAAVQRNKPEMKQLLDAFKAFIGFMVDHVLPILGPTLKLVFRSIGTQISAVIDAIAGLVDAFNTVKDGINGVVSFVKNLPARITAVTHHMWDGIKNSFKAAINYIIDGWNGLEFKLPSLDLGPLGKVGGFDIRVPQIPRLAQGGAVIGQGSWTSDSITARLSNGEHVWPAREVAALGGQQAMYQLRHVLTGYAAGGAVGPSAGLLAAASATRGAGLTRLSDLAGGAAAPLHYEQHLHYPVPDSVSHGQMRAQQILLHELSNR